MDFETAILTSQGERASNQDVVRTAEAQGCVCWVIADGLGGYRGGAAAATLACDAFVEGFRQFAECSPEAMLTYLGMANRAVRQAQLGEGIADGGTDRAGMRTTIAAVVANESQWIAGHCGDSRIYHLRNGAISYQSRDHSLVQALVDAGQLSVRGMGSHPDRNRLLRCLGEEDEVRAELSGAPGSLAEGDAFVLATDGFWEHVAPREMEAEYAKAPGPDAWLRGMAGRLRQRVAEELQRKRREESNTASGMPPEHSTGQDNYSAIAVFRGAGGGGQ